jgi:hypothetical protein
MEERSAKDRAALERETKLLQEWQAHLDRFEQQDLD